MTPTRRPSSECGSPGTGTTMELTTMRLGATRAAYSAPTPATQAHPASPRNFLRVMRGENGSASMS